MRSNRMPFSLFEFIVAKKCISTVLVIELSAHQNGLPLKPIPLLGLAR